MLNNQHLSKFSKDVLRFQTYEQRIKIYDRNCLPCPYSQITVKIGEQLIKVPTIEIAIEYCIDDARAHIKRECSADGGFTLEEITNNTCSLWYPIGEEYED